MNVLFWQRKDAAGSYTDSPVYLSIDAGISPNYAVNTEFTYRTEGPLVKLAARALYFPSYDVSPSGNTGTIAAAQRRADALRNAMRWAPPEVKQLARGRARAVNVSTNFGDVISTDAGVLLSNCWLESAAVADGEFLEGVVVDLVFARVADAATP